MALQSMIEAYTDEVCFMRLGLVFTNDWELYGDGTGDYFEIQHRPLGWLAKTMEDHGAKLTIMAEVCQQWSHIDIADKFSWASEIVSAWDSVLVNETTRGHDVQLHLHPQWLGAKYVGNRWHLNFDKWRLPNLPAEDIHKTLRKGKNHLETLLSKNISDYKCVAFRSGSYCIQPSSEIISMLIRNGFTCDTSVTKGMKQDGLFDFRGASSNFMPWSVNPEFIEQKADHCSGLIEIPIYSKSLWDSPILRWKFGFCYGTLLSSEEKKWFDETNRIANVRYPKKNRPFWNRFKPIHLVQAFLRKTAVQLDYDHLGAEIFIKMLKYVIKDSRTKELENCDVIVPIIASGHTKNMHNAENIERILDRLEPLIKEKTIVYWTLTEAIQYWSKRLSRSSQHPQSS